MSEKNLKKWEYDSEKAAAYKLALETIEGNQLVFFMNDVIAHMPFHRQKFYRMFPIGSPELEEMKRLLNKNKVRAKLSCRGKMYEMNSPTAIIALYRLIADDDEREALSSARPLPGDKEEEETTKVVEKNDEAARIDIAAYTAQVKATLKKVNRYSPVLDFEISALASAWATLNAANRTISELDNNFITEVTTQGEKTILHPAFALQQRALESMSKHAKLLGIDYENAPEVATDGPLATLTKEMIAFTKTQQGHMSVDKEKKTKRKKNEEGSKKGRKQTPLR